MPQPKKLPRLKPGQKAPVKTEEVDLPEFGASVVIRQPSVREYIEFQKVADGLDLTEQTMALTALCVVEPDFTVETLREAIDTWPFSDWVVLQRAVSELSGMGGEELRAAQTAFRSGANG